MQVPGMNLSENNCQFLCTSQFFGKQVNAILSINRREKVNLLNHRYFKTFSRLSENLDKIPITCACPVILNLAFVGLHPTFIV